MSEQNPANDIVMLEGGPLIDDDELTATLGWTLKPEGLCRDDECVPVPDPSALRSGERLDVTRVADMLDRPSAVDEPSGRVAIGTPRHRRRQALDDLTAPDFVLPDVDGNDVALSEYRGRKRLLVAFASW